MDQSTPDVRFVPQADISGRNNGLCSIGQAPIGSGNHASSTHIETGRITELRKQLKQRFTRLASACRLTLFFIRLCVVCVDGCKHVWANYP